jgi:NHLM bacteriocin system ABC transporter ATP-binding protein
MNCAALQDRLPQHVHPVASDSLLVAGAWDLFLFAPIAGSHVLEPLGRVTGPALLPRCSDVQLGDVCYRVVAAATPDARSEAAPADATIDAWINGAVAISQWTPAALVEGEYVPLEAGRRAECAAGRTAAASKLVLVRVLRGRFRASGPAAFEIGADQAMMLPREVSLTAIEPGVLEVMRVGHVDTAERWQALRAIWTATVANACAVHQARPALEAQRLEARRATFGAEMRDSVEALSALLDETVMPIEKPDAQRRAGLLAAFESVTKALNVSFRPTDAIAQASGPDGAQALAEAAGVRSRRVTLTAGWWRNDSGPMIGFREQDGHAVALMPDGRGGYVADDGGDHAAQRMDDKLAESLSPTAFVFYRPLPHKVLTDLDLLRFGLGGYRHELGMVVLLAGMAGALGLVLPLASAKLVDSFIPAAQKAQVIQLGIALIVVALVQTLLSLTRGLTILRIQDKMDLAIQAAVWDRVLHMPVAFYRRYTVASLAARVRSCTRIIRIYSAGTVVAILGGGFALLNFAVLFFFSASLSLIALLLVALVAASVIFFRRRSVSYFIEAPQSKRNLNTLVLHLIQGATKLRSTAAEARAFAVWAKEHALSQVPTVRNQRLMVFQQVFFRCFDHMAVLVLFAAAQYFLFRSGGDHLSAGEFVGFFAAFGGVFHGVLALCETLVDVVAVSGAYHNARPILETLPEAESGKVDPGEITGAIEVKGVSFAYPGGEQVLADVSFSARPGDFIVIVGPSGSGKSTLLRLLLGFDRPSGGSILYDAHDLNELKLRQLRRQFGVVLHDTRLLAGNLLSNIHGDREASLDAAWEAAGTAALDQDIHAMPMGMYTSVDEGGTTLSSGQRQRVLIARALAGRPKVLFFDEATSVLDGAAQAKITANLQRMRITRVMIGLRSNALADADQIIVLDSGRIVQSGRYDELIRTPGMFTELLAGERQRMDASHA